MYKNKNLSKHKKLHVCVKDTVRVMSGNHKGKQGEILSIDRIKMRVKVKEVNMITKHIKPTENKEGRIETVEGTIHISNLQHITKDGKVSRIGRKKDEKGKTVRYLKKTGEVL